MDQITDLALAVADRIARLKELEGETELSPERDELQTIAGVIEAHRQRLEDDPKHEADSNVNSAVHKALEHLWEPIEGRVRQKRYYRQLRKSNERLEKMAVNLINKLAEAQKEYSELERKSGFRNRVKLAKARVKLNMAKSDAADLQKAINDRASEPIFAKECNRADREWLELTAKALSDAQNNAEGISVANPPTE